jgi:hypothetical protein
LKQANAMLDTEKTKRDTQEKTTERSNTILIQLGKYIISIKDDKSSYEKFFGVPSPISPETCVNFARN